MNKEEIFEMARQAGFEGCAELTWEDVVCTEELVAFAKLIAEKAIEEALAQPEQYPKIAINAEIVGYVSPQRTWVGLTDEEILVVNMSTVTKLIDEPIVCDTDHNIIQLGKAIEAKLKHKNTRGQE